MAKALGIRQRKSRKSLSSKSIWGEHHDEKQRYLAQRIKKLFLAGLTQTEISRVCKVSRATTRYYLRAQNLPTRQHNLVPAADVIADCLHHLDGLFPELPFGPEHDAIFASAIINALKHRTPGYFAQATKSNALEFEGLIRSALFVKRAYSDQGMVH
jgi:hypothetical protein